MKDKIFRIICIISSLICLDPGPALVFAEDESSVEALAQGLGESESLPDASTEALRFFAVNAGYKDDNSAQNYDFIALEKLSDEALALADFELVYTNSSGKEAGNIAFVNEQELQARVLVLGFAKSPQYAENDAGYLYNFGSAGLASTAGKLSLFQNKELVDEVCWGKIACAHQLSKFATDAESNFSAVLRDGEFVQEKYYPDIDEAAILRKEKEKNYCQNLQITEIYSYYEESSAEQFVELYNSGDDCLLDGLNIGYKNKSYPLTGMLSAGAYLSYQDASLALTKDPTSSNTVSIIDDVGEIIDEVSYPHGQKAGRSYAQIGGQWSITYARTPGAENVLQEYQTCPEGKVINEETGNCINEDSESETVCPDGKYLNPETGRCKKIEEESTLGECAEGYERNPETNRCRKIQDTDGSEYAPRTSASTSYSEPRRFVAYIALGLAILAGLIYVVFQYRQEITKFFRTLAGSLKRITSKHRLTLST